MSGIRSMSERYQRPDWVRRLNAMGDSVGGGPEGARRLIPIDADALLTEAERSIGTLPTSDFGDPDWRRRFRELAPALDASPLHVVGRLLTKQELLRSLRTRLLLCRTLDERPAIVDERVEAPVIVTGPARSGTSITFELFWLDPTLRAPLAWEALYPVGTPDDGRAAWSECEQELWADVQPEFAAVHELKSDLPVECVTLTAPCFAGPHWPMISQAVSPPDPALMYDFHRRILQVLQHGAEPRSWLLKTPGHLATLDLLFATYPDAWVVQTHRDPAKTMPSTVSTTALVQWMRTDDVDAPKLSAAIEAVFGFALNQVAERRARGELPDRFVDVHFQDLMRDPVATLGAAYERMGRPFSDAHAGAIRRYLADKPKGKFGVHSYTPEEWGYTADGLRKRLAPYIEHFGVALEGD
ncbi:MAG: sulfotransferase [Myxococcota bacterium]